MAEEASHISTRAQPHRAQGLQAVGEVRIKLRQGNLLPAEQQQMEMIALRYKTCESQVQS